MINIDDIYEMLNWKNDTEIQLKGMSMAQNIDDLSLFIQPKAEPSVWENCARVLYEKSDDVLEPYLSGMLEWLQDLNWPGALMILKRLKCFSGKKLKNAFIDSVTYAMNLNNEDGLRWVGYLSELLDNEELKEELPKEILSELQKCYHNEVH